MVKLVRFNRRRHREIGAGRQLRIKAAKLYYVERRRNTWNSVPSFRYASNSISTELACAQSAAENWREMGSTFTIYELPSLVIDGENGSIAVTHMDRSKPLSGLLAMHRTDSKVEPALKWEIGKDLNALQKSIEQVHLSWHRFDGSIDNLLCLRVPADVETSNLGKRGTRLRKWTSSSDGGQYKLHWWEQWSSDFSGAAVRNCVETLDAFLREN